MHEGAIAGVLARADCTEERIMTLAVGQPDYLAIRSTEIAVRPSGTSLPRSDA
jgi:hypothetical protein